MVANKKYYWCLKIYKNTIRSFVHFNWFAKDGRGRPADVGWRRLPPGCFKPLIDGVNLEMKRGFVPKQLH